MGSYVVIAGNSTRPETITRGVIEKGLGQTAYTEVGTTFNRRGDVGFPNRSDAWGRRIVRDAKGRIVESDRDVDVKDNGYKGEIEFLKWNDPKGRLIVCRYLKGYDTLDMLYQNIVLNADENLKDDNEASGDAQWIRLTSGDNEIDENETPLFAKMLQIHDYNESSISRSPNNTYFLLRDKKFESVEADDSKMLSSKFEALRIVNEAAQDNSFGKLRNLAKIAGGHLEGLPKDEHLLSVLQRLADSKPSVLVALLAEHKKIVENVIEKAINHDILDLNENKVVAKEGNKQVVLAENCPGSGTALVAYLIDDCLDEKSYETAFQLKKITDKLNN